MRKIALTIDEEINKRRGRKAEQIVLIPKQILVEAKRCVSCNQYKQLSDYGKESRTKSGLRGSCKSCEYLNKNQRKAESI